MKKIGLLLVGFLFAATLSLQVKSQGLNFTLLSQTDDNLLPVGSNGIIYSQVMGWRDAVGNEYAIVGILTGIRIYNVTDPYNPWLVTTLSDGCPDCRQRDFKINNGYLYAVSDYNTTFSAFRVWNLNSLPGSMPTMTYNDNARFTTAHSIEINPLSGRAYIVGASTRMNGLIIYDIGTTPSTPTHLQTFTLPPNGHDAYIHRDTVIYFGGNSGIGKYNMVNLAAPANLGAITTYAEQGFAHSGWMTSDGNTLVVCDETNDKGVKIFDVTDITNPTLLSVFRSNLMAPTFTNSMAHSPYILNDTLLFIAYYHDGVQLYNIKNKSAPVRIGYYDTHTTHTDYLNFQGCIAIYPYLPSRNILALDAQNGLFILGSSAVNYPVTLSSFTAQPHDGKVALNWTTESESQNKGFVVQRSEDGSNFADIGFVQGQGDHVGHLEYSFDDLNPTSGVIHYRLLQQDLDGGFTYSKVVTINQAGEFAVTSVAPTLLGAGVPVEVNFLNEEDREVSLRLLDLRGLVVREVTASCSAGNAHISMPTDDLSGGAYLLQMTAGSHQQHWKLQVAN
jgi:choice-of-anchor B domain-containing protein